MKPPPQPQQPTIMSPPTSSSSIIPRPTQLPTQPTPNPNNKPLQQLAYSADPNQFPAYAMSASDIHFRSGTTFPAPSTPIITKLPVEEEEHQNVPI